MTLQTDHAAQYANGLLAFLGQSNLGQSKRINCLADHPALAWQRSGLQQTTGLMLPLPLASAADGALMALKAVSPHADRLPMQGSLLVGERARLRNTIRQGRFCAGGYGRLLDTGAGRIALNLVRDEDWDLIPAWLEADASSWDDIARIVCTRSALELAERAAEIGLAVALDRLPDRSTVPYAIKNFAAGSAPKNPLIVDLSGLWAGPLASSLLAMGGARVIKVEGDQRPDGMRFGHAGFCDLLNAGKDCVALNFRDPDGLAQLKTLLHRADVVITASRPRALEQLGLIAEDFIAAKPGKIWARLTAYGVDQNRIGFGDDIAISAGLATVMEHAHAEPCFVGDAIADPVNGLHLALAIQASLSQGGGQIIDQNMCHVLRYAMGDFTLSDCAQIAREWQGIADQDRTPLYALREPPADTTHALGADNGVWLC